eukprot:UN24407
MVLGKTVENIKDHEGGQFLSTTDYVAFSGGALIIFLLVFGYCLWRQHKYARNKINFQNLREHNKRLSVRTRQTRGGILTPERGTSEGRPNYNTMHINKDESKPSVRTNFFRLCGDEEVSTTPIGVKNDIHYMTPNMSSNLGMESSEEINELSRPHMYASHQTLHPAPQNKHYYEDNEDHDRDYIPDVGQCQIFGDTYQHSNSEGYVPNATYLEHHGELFTDTHVTTPTT